MSRFTLAVALLAAVSHVVAQTSTTCNPLKKTCPQDPALGTTFYEEFNSTMIQFNPDFYSISAGTDLISFGDNGAELSISKQGESVTLMTKFYIFFGQVEVLFQAASGQGIISTFDLLSDDLDEIDWEIMGGNTSYVENNWYGWGNLSQFNSEYYPTKGSGWQGGAMGGIHNFSLNWNQDQIEYIMDGQVVRTVQSNVPGQYPQTPCYLKFGIWAGGASTEPKGTIQWAGGPVNWDQGPFTMTVKSIKIVDGHQGSAFYKYGDTSGSWQSIDVVKGHSNAYKLLNQKSTTQKVEKKWNGLSTGAKIGIACGVLGVFAIALIAFTFYCISQRRAGKREKAIADKAWDAQQGELQEYRNQMKRGQFAVAHMGHGEKF